MKAIVQDRHSPLDDALELQDIDAPVVEDNEVLVRVHATPIPGDLWHIMRGLPSLARASTGLLKPKSRDTTWQGASSRSATT